MEPFAAVDPADQVGYLLVRAAQLVSRPWLNGLREHGINPRQFSVLALLADAPGMSQAELARQSDITAQSMGELLVRLERAGLVRRMDAGAGRAAQVEITETGQATLGAAYPIVRSLQESSVASLNPREQETLRRLLRQLITQHTDERRPH